jgi:PAS domain S-box-containing protein
MDKSAAQAKITADRSTVVFLAVACLFPIGATFLDLLRHGLPFSGASILAVQTTQPLHWLIDAVPLLVLVLTQMSARMKQPSTTARTGGQGENSTTKLTQTVTELKADLAKLRRSEETLRASEEFYRNLVENTNDGIATISLDGTLTSVNRGFERMLGRLREEIVGKHYSAILSVASLSVTEDRIRRFQAGEKLPSLSELELLHHNGNTIRVEVRTRAITDKSGTAIGFQGVYRDVAKRAAMHSGTSSSSALSSADVSSSSASAEAAMPPWSQLPSASKSTPESHYPTGYSPLSRNTPTSPASLQQHDVVSLGSSEALSNVGISGLPSSFHTPEPYASPTLETQSAPSAAPQFRFANAPAEAAGASPVTSSSEQSSFSASASPFTLAADRQKKDERQAKVVPFPAVAAQPLPTPPQLGSPGAQPIFNLDEALDRVDGDRELLREMATVFLDEYPLLLVTMQDALSHGNAQTLTFAVHTLKGSVANFAATNAFEAALKLEKIGRQGNLTQAKTALAELEAELARLAPLLTALKMEAAA